MIKTDLPLHDTDCANHPAVKSTVDCSVCGKPICADCSTAVSRGTVCEDPDHKIVLEEWDIVFRSNSEFEVDMIVRNLEYQGVHTRVSSSRKFKETIGEGSHDSAQVFVHRDEYEHATTTLSTLGLLDIEQSMPGSNGGGSMNV